MYTPRSRVIPDAYGIATNLGGGLAELQLQNGGLEDFESRDHITIVCWSRELEKLQCGFRTHSI